MSQLQDMTASEANHMEALVLSDLSARNNYLYEVMR